VKVRPDGTDKILDFGLAKALEETPVAGGVNNSPTISAAASREGMILGTAAYMSPEQARGKALDRRCDIWSFGAVLFEMLSGQQAFTGEDVSHTLAAVIMKESDWSALPATTPSGIQRLVRRCLNKDPRQRLRDIGDARIAIEEMLTGSPEVGAVREPSLQPTPPTARRRALPWALAALSALVLLALIVANVLRAPHAPTRPIARLVVALPPGDRVAGGRRGQIALAPDASRLVYVANHSGSTQLYLRAIDRFEATPIPGTDGAESPFFSPDGQSVGFFAEGKLRKVSLRGGAPLTLCSAPDSRGGSWGPDDTIIFAPSLTSGLFRISAAGGTPKSLTVPDRNKGEYAHRWPKFCPAARQCCSLSGPAPASMRHGLRCCHLKHASNGP
jgi:serine/threonine-protein kinase